jgi:hypothetical protein
VLTRAFEDLQSLEKLLRSAGDTGGGGEMAPLWMVCQAAGREVEGFMDAAEARDDLPPDFRATAMSDLAPDRLALRQAIEATRWPMPNEAAAPHFAIIRPLHMKWQRLATITGIVTK